MRRIKQEFIGEIDGIVISNQKLYHSLDFILEMIENKFGKCYNHEFVRDLIAIIEKLNYKYEDFSYRQLELELDLDVSNFEDMEFTYEYSDYYLVDFNRNLKIGNYNKNLS